MATNQIGDNTADGNIAIDDQEAQPQEKELIVGRSVKTRIIKQINCGAFGAIFFGRLLTSGEEVAVKLEPQKCPYHPQLLFEANVLRSLEGGPGIPKVHWYGLHEPDYNVMVIDLLGPSLQDLFAHCEHKFSLKTVLLILDQVVDSLEFVHDQHFIHRDVKPDNLMIGRREHVHKIFLIDYGLAKKYSGHRRYSSGYQYHVAHPLVGTARYCSVHAHLGHDDGFRDDMEALGYVLVYFLKGKLPWQGLTAETRKEKFHKIKEVKINTPLDKLCEGIPEEFSAYLNYTRALRTDDCPEYDRIKELFRQLAKREEIEYDNKYDWVIQQEKTGVCLESRGKTDHGHDSGSQ